MKISYYYGEDYAEYTKGINSYPDEIEEEKAKVEGFFIKACSSKIVRIVLLCLSILSLVSTLFGFISGENDKKNILSFYSSDFNSFHQEITEKGEVTYSITSAFKRPTIYQKEEGKFISIISSYDKLNVQSLNCYANYIDSDTKLNYTVNPLTFHKTPSISVSYYSYDATFSYKSTFTYNKETKSFELGTILDELTYQAVDNQLTADQIEKLKQTFYLHIDEILPSLSNLIKDKLGLNIDLFSFLQDFAKSSEIYNSRYYSFMLTIIISCMLFGLFAFLTCVVFIFVKRRKGTALDLVNSVENPVSFTSPKKEYRSLKTDIHFSPFLPESLFEITGIVLTFTGSILIIYYLSDFLISGNMPFESVSSAASCLSAIFTIGLFLLYFIQFDLFIDTKRGLHYACFNFILFFTISFIIGYTFTLINESNNIIFAKLTDYPITNPFGTIACYFLIIIFLFMTPRFINSKKKLIGYRLLSLIPIAIIIATTVIFFEYRNWGWNLNYFQKYLFVPEKPQFSLLCVSYLLILYFLKLYFQNKYGPENAKKYFRSNRFYLLKNIIFTSMILLIGVAELSMKNLGPSNLIVLGKYWQVIFIAPFLLFYHPHIGKKSNRIDWGIKGLYILLFTFFYAVIGVILFGIALALL